MYTMVLMMAMSGSGEAPNFGGRLFGGSSCHGSAPVAASCQGSVPVFVAAPAGCTGARPAGCTGGVVAAPAGCTGNSCHGGGFLGIRKAISSHFNKGCTGSAPVSAGCHGSVPVSSGCHGAPVAAMPVACPTGCEAPVASCATVVGVDAGCPTVAMPAPATVAPAPVAMPAVGETKTVETKPATEAKPAEKKPEAKPAEKVEAKKKDTEN
jgi:hypothetical protein